MSSPEFDFTITPTKRDLPQNRPSDVADFLNGPGYRLVLAEDMISGVRRQAGNSPIREIGGVLVGRHYRTGDNYVVHVQDYIPVPSGDSSAAHFVFDESSVRAILTGLTGRSEQYVVGWYHSHIGGPPFMSDMDVKLHSDHFSESWHISCVVSNASGRPAGFWRIADGRLTEVSDYALAISTAGEFAESQDLYLEACGLAAPPAVPRSFSRIAKLCGLEERGVLASVLAEAESISSSRNTLVDAAFTIRAAAAAAASPQVRPELAALAERLELLRVFDDVLTAVTSSPLPGEWITAHGRECYSYTRRTRNLVRFDLDLETSLPVRIQRVPLWVAHGTDGHAWILQDAGDDLIRLPQVDMRQWMGGDYTFEVATIEMPAIEQPRQIAPVGNRIWLRTSSEWHWLDITETPDSITVEGHESGALPRFDAVLVPANGFSDALAPPRVLALAEGDLTLWTMTGSVWMESARHALPQPWRTMRLQQAAQGGNGWYALLVDRGESHLCVFDTHSLAFVCHVLVDSNAPLVTGITGDGCGLVYVKAGGVLFRA